MRTIEVKWGHTTADNIKGCNASEKYAKAVRKVANRHSWDEARNLVTHDIVRRLDLQSRYL